MFSGLLRITRAYTSITIYISARGLSGRCLQPTTREPYPFMISPTECFAAVDRARGCLCRRRKIFSTNRRQRQSQDSSKRGCPLVRRVYIRVLLTSTRGFTFSSLSVKVKGMKKGGWGRTLPWGSVFSWLSRYFFKKKYFYIYLRPPPTVFSACSPRRPLKNTLPLFANVANCMNCVYIYISALRQAPIFP